MEQTATLTIGDLVKQTGLTEHTIRAWEKRYGFPVPHRLPSGHRRYSDETASRLSSLAQGVRFGLRPANAIRMSTRELDDFLDLHGSTETDAAIVANALGLVRTYDWPALNLQLEKEIASRGLALFCDMVLAPLCAAVGLAWSKGEIDIRHEHAFSSRVISLLDSCTPPASDLKGRPIVFATLVNEDHHLGLKMAEVCARGIQRPTLYLGANVPVDELIATISEVDPSHLMLSVTIYTANQASRNLIGEIADRLPPSTELVIGGSGSTSLGRLPPSVQTVGDLESLTGLIST